MLRSVARRVVVAAVVATAAVGLVGGLMRPAGALECLPAKARTVATGSDSGMSWKVVVDGSGKRREAVLVATTSRGARATMCVEPDSWARLMAVGPGALASSQMDPSSPAIVFGMLPPAARRVSLMLDDGRSVSARAQTPLRGVPLAFFGVAVPAYRSVVAATATDSRGRTIVHSEPVPAPGAPVVGGIRLVTDPALLPLHASRRSPT